MPSAVSLSAFAIACCLAFASAVSAQEPAPTAIPGDQLGRVTLETSCAPAAQARLPGAVALLHSFWWERAEQAFQQVAETDSSCVMALWGLAMTLRLNPFAGAPPEENLRRGWALLQRAAIMRTGTPRERGYLEAIAGFYRDFDQLEHHTRMLTHEVKMRELASRYPDDVEATVFYALAAAANAPKNDSTYERHQEIGALLDTLLRRYPDHPGIAHYLIHIYDSPELAHLGLDAARRYAQIAPAAYHALHMPSHIFVRLGMWDETIGSNLASAAVARSLEEQDEANGIHHARLHAMDYLAYAYLQRGHDTEARALAHEAHRVDSVAPGGQAIGAAYALAAIPARYALERRDWAQAAKLPVRPSPDFPFAEAIGRFARGIGAARLGDLQGARSELNALQAVERKLGGDAYWADLAKSQRLALSAWVAFAEGDTTNALLFAAEAADLEVAADKHPVTPGLITSARELQADLFVEFARYEDAYNAYTATLEREPNRARSVFGAAWAAQLAGEHAAAADWYARYVALMETATGDRPEVAVAKAYVKGYAQSN